jgi:hypothetical protein
MKRYLFTVFLASTAIPAFAADVQTTAPAEAQSRVSGHVEAYLGGLKVDSGFDDTNIWSAGGAGRVNVKLDERWNVQGDLFADRIWNDDGHIMGYGGAAHAFWRDPNAYAFGVFATAQTADIEFADVRTFTVGPEAQVYLDNWTLYGQAWYGQVDIDEAPVRPDIWGARGVVRYYVTPDLRFDGELAFQRRSVDEVDFDVDTFAAAIQASYRFSDTPFSVFGRYQYENISNGPFDVDLHKFVIGLRATFGAPTLQDEDRNGATMDTFRSNYVMPALFIGG